MNTGRLRMLYLPLCQTLLTYCITTYGGTAKSHMLHIEYAQRAVLVGWNLPRPSLTINFSLRALQYTLFVEAHSLIKYSPLLVKDKRRFDINPKF